MLILISPAIGGYSSAGRICVCVCVCYRLQYVCFWEKDSYNKSNKEQRRVAQSQTAERILKVSIFAAAQEEVAWKCDHCIMHGPCRAAAGRYTTRCSLKTSRITSHTTTAGAKAEATASADWRQSSELRVGGIYKNLRVRYMDDSWQKYNTCFFPCKKYKFCSKFLRSGIKSLNFCINKG